MEIHGRNINEVYSNAIWMTRAALTASKHLVEEDTRNGKARVWGSPVTSIYERPWERVLFSEARDANPFFHLMEGLWMLAGSNDARFLAYYNPNMLSFTDDYEPDQLYGAYGFRWRKWFSIDQLLLTIEELKSAPTSRRVVTAMWSPIDDLGHPSRDIPCNTHIYWRGKPDNSLDMTVCCRSNDMIWGAYGANAVHMSMLHELVANATGMAQGRYIQFSNNMHIYERHYPLLEVVPNCDLYRSQAVWQTPLVSPGESWEQFLDDCDLLVRQDNLDDPDDGYTTEFFKTVVLPARKSWDLYKWRRTTDAMMMLLARMPVNLDWTTAMGKWLERRAVKEKANVSQ